jgi:hypothetical protein
MSGSAPLGNVPFVVRNQTATVAEFVTDDHGHFKITLAPGYYNIVRKNQPKIGRCGPFDVDVANGQLTRVEWQCDTGMR